MPLLTPSSQLQEVTADLNRAISESSELRALAGEAEASMLTEQLRAEAAAEAQKAIELLDQAEALVLRSVASSIEDEEVEEVNKVEKEAPVVVPSSADSDLLKRSVAAEARATAAEAEVLALR